MADQLPTPDAGGIRWTKATSTNGVPFEIGASAEADQSSETKSATGNGANIYWPVGDGTWKETSQEVKEMGISRYRLFENLPSSIYRYTFEFTTTTGRSWNRWTFTQETGDRYSCITMRDGDQTVRFNSENPTFIYVAGP